MSGYDSQAHNAAAMAARRSYGRLVALLSARTRDVARAEDALSEAFAAALAEWPRSGTPRNPEAWLLAVARRRSIDAARHGRTATEASGHLQLLAEEMAAMAEESAPIPDERLSLMFACANPAIESSIRTPLILQTILGFDAETIASAFLVAPATMGQRLARAKAKIRLAGIPFRRPDRENMPERLDAVLAAIYAAFAEGWSDPTGAEAKTRNLAEEAIWLGRLIAELLPNEPEVLGLLALMLYSDARRSVRRDADGEFVPLNEQDPVRWDGALIDEAETLLRRAQRLDAIGRYQLEAALQSAHVARRLGRGVDWPAIVELYDALCSLTMSPVAAINRTVALAETEGAAAGLAALDTIAVDARLAEYQPYWAVRADLLARAGERAAAHEAYDRAIGLESDPAVRRFLQRRQAAV
ncbi:RNA polymerase sigma factor [Bradyrhizobium sp. ORS 111]|uniref:RNA polymerase sigma factor n=1 Tax=Bradyrhizobium sp. ORS 111 TaxID=1685958 RepID=UPI00388D532B